MRKYRSTDSHYLELATCNFNFGSLKNNAPSSPILHSTQKAIIQPLQKQQEDQIPFIRQITNPTENSHFYRLPDDIFISEEPLHDQQRQHFSIFKSINSYKNVSYTMMDKMKNVVHCFLEEKNPTDIQCSSWTKVADRFSNTMFAPLAQHIQDFYIKREDGNESLSMSTKEESYQVLPEFSTNSNGISSTPIFLNQFQLAQEKEDVSYIEKILSNPNNQQPQIIFRRMFVHGKGTILRSIHINSSFLNMVNCSPEDFLLCTALRKAIPDIFYSLNYMQIMKKALFKIDNYKEQEIFNHSILTYNNQQIDIECRYEGANMPNSKLVIWKVTNTPSVSHKFAQPSPIYSNPSSPIDLSQNRVGTIQSLNKKRKLFEREDVIVTNAQSRILYSAFGLKFEDISSNSSLNLQNEGKTPSPQNSQTIPSKQNKQTITHQQNSETNSQVSQIEKIFKLRMNY